MIFNENETESHSFAYRISHFTFWHFVVRKHPISIVISFIRMVAWNFESEGFDHIIQKIQKIELNYLHHIKWLQMMSRNLLNVCITQWVRQTGGDEIFSWFLFNVSCFSRIIKFALKPRFVCILVLFAYLYLYGNLPLFHLLFHWFQKLFYRMHACTVNRVNNCFNTVSKAFPFPFPFSSFHFSTR